MAYGLIIRDSSSNVSFDSTLATGGVCLGIRTIAAGGETVSFPDMIGTVGIVIATHGTGSIQFTTDSAPGYLRFIFTTFASGRTVVMFAK
jgi:hypothetical protein